MRVRLAGIPAAYTLATDVMVVDEDDNLYLIGCDEPAVTPLDDSDTMLIMGFYEPVQSVNWHRIDKVIDAVRIASDATYPADPAETLAMMN